MTLYSKKKNIDIEYFSMEDIEKHITDFVSEVCTKWSIEQDNEIDEIAELELKHFGFATVMK